MRSVLARYTRFCVEKIFVKNWVGGEKMTNIRYVYAGLERNPDLNEKLDAVIKDCYIDWCDFHDVVHSIIQCN